MPHITSISKDPSRKLSAKLIQLSKPATFAAILIALAAPGAIDSKQSNLPLQQPDFDREQKMLLNLKQGVGSSGYYLLHSLRGTQLMVRDLEKATKQVEEVDKTYAKSRKKPDNRYLQAATLKIANCRQQAETLEAELHEAFAELKKSINQALVLEE